MDKNKKKEIDRVLEEVIKDEDQGALDAYAEAELTSPYPEDKETAKYMKEKLAEKGITDWKIKKLTLRLDSEHQDLLTKLEKRFPSLSQNQIINHALEYGGEKILSVVGKDVPDEEEKKPRLFSTRINGNQMEWKSMTIKLNDEFIFGHIVEMKITSNTNLNSNPTVSKLELTCSPECTIRIQELLKTKLTNKMESIPWGNFEIEMKEGNDCILYTLTQCIWTNFVFLAKEGSDPLLVKMEFEVPNFYMEKK